jgi:type VI secretion system secreted protein Hcp
VSEQSESSGASRRDVLKTGALGVGALASVVGASGLAASPAAATPIVAAAALPTGTDNYFLKLDGVPGDSTDAKHKGEIQLLSFAWGASNSGTASSTGGAGAGKVSFSDFTFTAKTSQASPLLMLNTATGKRLKTGLITVARKNRGGQEFIKIELTDVLVTSYQQGAGNGSVPLDSASLAFSKITFSFSPQRPDGSLGPAVTATWDLRANKSG